MATTSSFFAPKNRAPALTALFLAALFAVVVVLPSVFQRHDEKYPYGGVEILGADQEVYYAARVREVYDGFPSLGNTFYSAPKDLPYLQPPLPELTIGSIGMLLHVQPVTAFMLSKIIFSFAVFLLAVLLVFTVTGSPWIAIASAVCMLFAGSLLSAPWNVLMFLHPSTAQMDFIRFARAVNPQWTVSWFLLATILLARWIQSGNRRFALLTALGATVLMYSYVYAWTLFFAAVGLLTLWYIVRRDWKRVRDLALFWIVTALLCSPYVIHVLQTSHHPWYSESMMRFGLVYRRTPLLFGAWLAAFLVVAAASYRLWRSSWPLLPALALGGFVAINQHIITSYFVVPHHYHWYFIQPLGSLFAVAAALTIATSFVKSQGVRTAFVTLLLLFAITSSIIQQYAGYRSLRDVWGPLQLAKPALSYIGEHFHSGDVVYAVDVGVSNLVPIYSSADMYFAGNANLSLVDPLRIRHQFFLDLWLQGVTAEQGAREFYTTLRWTLSSRIHSIYYRESLGDYAAMPDFEVAKEVAAFQTFSALSLKEKLTRFPLTVILTSPGSPDSANWKKFLSCGTEVFSRNGYTVRRVIPAGERESCL
jgi:hypothetical protein